MPAPKYPLRIAVSPLTKQAYVGRLKDNGKYAEVVGPRTDVTNDVYTAIIVMVGDNKAQPLMVDGELKYTISVVKGKTITRAKAALNLIEEIGGTNIQDSNELIALWQANEFARCRVRWPDLPEECYPTQDL